MCSLSDHELQVLDDALRSRAIRNGESVDDWISDREIEWHTSFRLSEGETVALTRPDGVIVDQFHLSRMRTDVSLGRVGEGEILRYFDTPSAGEANGVSGAVGFSKEPELSVAAGFHEAPFDLEILSDDPEAIVLYTLDGSEPDEDNLEGKTYSYKQSYSLSPADPLGDFYEREMRTWQYSGSIPITDRSGEPNQISSITTTVSREPLIPSVNILKGTVVRTKTVRPGFLPSETVTATYLVGSGMRERFDLDVVSVSADEAAFFDFESGIFVPGRVVDDWRLANPELDVDQVRWFDIPGNYHEKGPEWERPGHFEFFTARGVREAESAVGLRVHGKYSRILPRKTIRFYTRSRYDSNDLDYPLMENRVTAGSREPLTLFRTFLSRNSGGNHSGILFREAVIQSLIEDLPLDYQGYRPVAQFINGEYWGIQFLRERQDSHYIVNHYGIDPDDVVMMSGRETMDHGEFEDYYQYESLLRFVVENDIQAPGIYEDIQERMDIDNHALYYALQIYAANTDWPHGNIAFWKRRTPHPTIPDQPGHDGRWRWLVFDLDEGFHEQNTELNTIRRVTESHEPVPEWATELFRALIQHPDYRRRFINHLADVMNHTFHPQRVLNRLDMFEQRISQERPHHVARWRSGSRAADLMRNFAVGRPAVITHHILDEFNLSSTNRVAVAVPDPELGSIKVNSIRIAPDLDGVDVQGVWSGTYFSEVPVRLEAVAAPGFRFTGWTELPDHFSPVVVRDPEGMPEVVSAMFERIPVPLLIHYWSFSDVSLMLTPNGGVLVGSLTVQTGDSTEWTADEGQGFSGLNARLGHGAGYHLRLNDPLGSVLTFHLPTDQLNPVFFRYEARRSGQGAGGQRLEYSVDGETFLPLGEVILENADPVLIEFDLEGLEGVADNPLFTIRLTVEQGDGGTAGNQRIDNVTLEGFPLEGIPGPPVVLEDLPNLAKQAGESPVFVDPAALFVPKEVFPVEFSAESENPEVAEVQWIEDGFEVVGLSPGQTTVVVVADSGSPFGISEVRLPVTVYPAAFAVSTGSYAFGYWDAEEPEGSYPVHMVFVQSQVSDPELDAPLPDFYRLDTEAYHEDDIGTIGFPYNNTRRTRITGLGERGISFLNTGQERDLGGALLVLDTRGVGAVEVSWVAEVLTESARPYGLRLQYRVGSEAPFEDVLLAGEAVELLSVSGVGEQVFQVRLPAALMEQSSLQLLWRYYALGGGSGPRPEIRLDDITVEALELAILFPPEDSLVPVGPTWFEMERFVDRAYGGRVWVNGELMEEFDELPRGFFVDLGMGDLTVTLEAWPLEAPEHVLLLEHRIQVLESGGLQWVGPADWIQRIGSQNLVYSPLSEVDAETGWRGSFGRVPGMRYGEADPFGGDDALYIPGADMGGSPIPNSSGIILDQAQPPSGGLYLVSAWLRTVRDSFPAFLGMSDLARQTVMIESQWQRWDAVVHYPDDPPTSQYRVFQVTERVTENPGWFVYDPRVYALETMNALLVAEDQAAVATLEIRQNGRTIHSVEAGSLEGEIVVDTLGYTVLVGHSTLWDGSSKLSESRVLYVGESPVATLVYDEGFQMEVRAGLGQRIMVESSTDLVNWQMEGSWIQREAVQRMDLELVQEVRESQHYYRVIQVPTWPW